MERRNKRKRSIERVGQMERKENVRFNQNMAISATPFVPKASGLEQELFSPLESVGPWDGFALSQGPHASAVTWVG